MRTLLNIAVGLAALTIPGVCAAASLQDLCVFQTADPGVSARISWQDVSERRSYVEDNYQQIQKLFETIQTFESAWITPVDIWPQDATEIEVIRYHAPICQIIFDRDSLYVALKGSAGFLTRELSASEHEALGSALPLTRPCVPKNGCIRERTHL